MEAVAGIGWVVALGILEFADHGVTMGIRVPSGVGFSFDLKLSPPLVDSHCESDEAPGSRGRARTNVCGTFVSGDRSKSKARVLENCPGGVVVGHTAKSIKGRNERAKDGGGSSRLTL